MKFSPEPFSGNPSLCAKPRGHGESRLPERVGGFTLVEMLVSLALISFLAALVALGGGAISDRSASVKCLGNLRQISVGLTLYAADNHGDLPPQNWWSAGAAPCALTGGGAPNGLGHLVARGYVGQAAANPVGGNRPKIFECPSPNGRKFFKQNSNWCSYVYQNPFFLASGAGDPARGQKLTKLWAGWALVVDAGQVFAGNPPVHNIKGNDGTTAVLYADGHAEMRPWIGKSGKSTEAGPSKFDQGNIPRN